MIWLTCPCGTTIEAEEEEGFIAAVEAHLVEQHPDLAGKYEREQIMFMAHQTGS